MPKKTDTSKKDSEFILILQEIGALSAALAAFSTEKRDAVKALAKESNRNAWLQNRLGELRNAASRLDEFIHDLTPSKIERIQLTLAQSESIARYFAFIFVQRPRLPLDKLPLVPFYGAGIYAIYYVGDDESIYAPLRQSETPIYLGKADPAVPYADTTFDQGMALHSRLTKHAKNIALTSLKLSSFEYRFATVQSGQQSAVEGFLIHFFRPIWNWETKVAYGVGKHGDAASTRANSRSPWDTLHPGRTWAAETKKDQFGRADIVLRIAEHFVKHPPFRSHVELLEALSRI